MQRNHRRGTWTVRRRLTLFFVLAFLISWLIWPLTLLNPQSSPMAPFGPAVAAVVVTLLSEGQDGLLRLVRQLGRWRIPGRWYLAAIGLPCLMVAVSAALTVAGGAPARDLGPNPGWLMLIGTFASTLVIVGLFEELGWRGYALPLLQRSHTALGAALLLGVVWALWHLPELASDPTGQPSMRRKRHGARLPWSGTRTAERSIRNNVAWSGPGAVSCLAGTERRASRAANRSSASAG
jgi:hypothetical protein